MPDRNPSPLLTLTSFELNTLLAGGRLGSLALFQIGIVFTTYLALGPIGRQLSPMLWAVLFWLLQSFAALQLAERLYGTEYAAQKRFFYALTPANPSLASKVLAQSVIQLSLSLGACLLFRLLLTTNGEMAWPLLIVIIVGSLALTACLQLVAALAAATAHPARYTALLGTPILVPILLETIRATKRALDGLAYTFDTQPLPLAAMGAIGLALAVFLYSYIWHE